MKPSAPTLIAVALLAAGGGVSLGACAAAARVRHHRVRHLRSVPAVRDLPAAGRAAPARSFYPENVKGGVSGNLPFNNQIRKFTDPLNANGSR